MRPSTSGAKPLRVLFLSSEVAPFSKTGGLGDVAGALPRALARLGHQVRVVTPLYAQTSRASLERVGTPLILRFPFGSAEVTTWRHVDEFETLLIESAPLFGRPELYGFPDDGRRFSVLCAAALTACQRDGFDADVVHANDWQTAPALFALRTGYAHTPLGKARRVFTIHNLAFQGLFPPAEVDALGLPWSAFTFDQLEFYGQLSFMKMALTSADVVNTVSPSYAAEIRTTAFGVGLDGLLRQLGPRLHGILNGIDTDVWNPATDVFLPEPFSLADLTGRTRCRSELLASVKLEPPAEGMPLFGVVGRMSGQKGGDWLQAALPAFLEQGASVVVLGSGEPNVEAGWRALAARYPRRVAVRVGFEESLAHRIEAGVDFFLMPSKFEPCGLTQLYSLRYGAVPVVHAVGGLKDTVVDFEQPSGNGVVFDRPHADALRVALVRAVGLFRDRARYAQVQRQGMQAEHGWGPAAEAYERLYMGP